MGDILPFSQKKRKPTLVSDTNSSTVKPSGGNTLCKSGFHKWKTDTSTGFSVKQGKLQTRKICERCGKTKTEFT